MAGEKLLVVDDDALIRWTLRSRLEQEGYAVVEAASAAEARQAFVAGVDLVLLDFVLPDTKGYDLLEGLLESEPQALIIVLTGHPSIDHAVQAMRLGAYHYIVKPFDLDEMALVVQRALEVSRLRRRVRALQRPDPGGLEHLVGESPEMQRCKELVLRIAQSPSSTVLLTGESGTGKDLVAKAIHSKSERSSGPFVNITCTALTSTLLESELFGHERGAFTDAKERKAGLITDAQGGTVFLDEIGDMAPALQAKLLRVIEDKCFRPVGGTVDIHTDVRIIAATNADLEEAVRRRTFREDLYYRLAVLTVHLPPLRERDGDVRLLLNYYVEGFVRQFKKPPMKVAPAAVRRLEAYPWPGNVRELRNAVERAVLLSEEAVLTERDFDMIPGGNGQPRAPDVVLPPGGIDLRELERSLVAQALERSGGNRTVAATLLGLNRDQVRYRIEKYSLRGTGE